MKIKKYTAPSMKEALEKVKEELGNDAIILNTRSNRRGGVLDFMKYSQFEITAAYDDRRENNRVVPEQIPEKLSPSPERRNNGIYAAGQTGLRPSNSKRVGDIHVKELTERIEFEQVVDDLKELKRSVRVLAENAAAAELGGLPRHLAGILKDLTGAGFEEKIAKGIVRQLLNELSGTELNDRTVIIERAIELLGSSMGEICPITLAGATPRFVAFVGPTGTGKTTTIAKLATEFSLNRKKNVSVLTIDTKRIDAVGQLKSYCRIIDIPLHIAYSPEELPEIMPKLVPGDLTLIDTPGAGPMDRPQMLEMVEFLQRLAPQEIHLTMSVTTALSEMHRIAKNFDALNPNRILFTKLDETDYCGTMYSFAIESKKPMSYVTFGQNVPGDFGPADPPALLRKCLTRQEDGE